MTKARHPLLRFVRRAARAHQDPCSDGQLLEKFLRQRDEEAFAVLVRRHGSMVMGVCRRVLQHSQDAEDAFQATFLVLLRKANSVRPRDRVGAWLYGVACRTALEAKKLRARRKDKESQAPPPSADADERQRRDLTEVIDQQIRALPEKYRLPILLCDLQSKTQAEAAQQLGWPEGTVSGRLFRARQTLARRLRKQGVGVSAAALSTILSQTAKAVSVPGPLHASTMQAARERDFKPAWTVGDPSSPIQEIVEGVLRAMWTKQLKVIAIVVLALGISLGALGVYAKHLLADEKKPPKTPEVAAGPKETFKPLTATQRFQTMERKLLDAKTIQVSFAATADLGGNRNAVINNGKLLLSKPDKVRMESHWNIPGRSESTMTIISDGKQTIMRETEKGKEARAQKSDSPKRLREGMVMGLSRSGMIIPFTLVHNSGPDGKAEEVDPSKAFRVSKLRYEKDEKVGGETAKVVHYVCELKAGKDDTAQYDVKVWLSPKTNLPLKRVIVAKDKKTTETFTETYSAWVLGKPIDPKQFDVPME